jgi:CRISPR/Cas system-associated exonuclease Cas4 (RecB family)
VFSIKTDAQFGITLKKNLAEKYKRKRRTISERVHVSDILPSSCLRRQYYSRIMSEEQIIDDSQVHSFVRGEASEHIITTLANIGVAQVPIEMDGIIAHPDIMVNGNLVIELKNTAGNRLTLDDTTFQGYLLQLLYYMVMTQIEKGILAIRYEVKDLQWVGRDSQGDHYVRALDAKPPNMECFQIILSLDDPMRMELKEQMILRKELFLKALATKDVRIVPRLMGKDKTIKCKHCQFKTRCWDQDGETIEAMNLAVEHRSNRLFDDLNNSMINNHID